MKIKLHGKIMIFLIIIFFMMPSLSPAQDVKLLNIIDEDLSFKSINKISSEQQLKSYNLGESIIGEKLDPIDYGLGYIEHMDDCINRDQIMQSNMDIDSKNVTKKHGIWAVPSIGASYYPHSGKHYITNKWGDTRMGISFPTKVDLHGAWFAGQGGGEEVWTSGVRVIGYCNGILTQTTNWFEDISDIPRWFSINLKSVDRVVFEATPVYNGAGWYAMDDLTFTPKIHKNEEQPIIIVLDFEDCFYNQKLSGSDYANLIWETGTGDYNFKNDKKSFPQKSFETNIKSPSTTDEYTIKTYINKPITSPTLINDYRGVIRGDATSWSYPPDSCGAAGPNHYVEVVNRNFAVYNKSSGEELINILLGSFLPESNGDPRVLYDQFSNRWFVIVCDFDTKLFLAVSTSDDPTQDWFKCNFVVSQGSDAGKWPDYPTLGVDEVGIYTAAYMIGGGNGMSIFALDKSPLIAEEPSIGNIYAFRELPWEGAIQPTHTFGTTEGEYFISRSSSTSLRVRLLSGLTDTPTLTEFCQIPVPSHSEPPDAPALGSSVPLDTVGHRLMNAVYRDGYIWTAHCINTNGRAASRWYKIDVSNTTLEDYGTVMDSFMYYYFPTIMVNSRGDAILGFSGSHSNQYAAAYFTGRLSSDPPGEMAPPILLKEGEATYNLIDSYGRNRWGDYSLCSLDPIKHTFWTIQEYAHSHNESGENRWGTWIGELSFSNPPETPIKPDGPNEWSQYVETTFSTMSTDPDGDQIFYRFDWGDGNFSDWIGPYNSGETGEASYNWQEIGEYEVKAIAKDINGVQSNWSEPSFILIIENENPSKVVINGANIGFGGVDYEFKFVSTDSEDHKIYYKIDWDDGTNTGYIGPYSSGEQITLSHSWNLKDKYWIKAWAKDEMGAESQQANHQINILTDKALIYNKNPLFI